MLEAVVAQDSAALPLLVVQTVEPLLRVLRQETDGMEAAARAAASAEAAKCVSALQPAACHAATAAAALPLTRCNSTAVCLSRLWVSRQARQAGGHGSDTDVLAENVTSWPWCCPDHRGSEMHVCIPPGCFFISASPL